MDIGGRTRILQALGISADGEQAYLLLVRDGTPPSAAQTTELLEYGLVQIVDSVAVPLSVETALRVWSSARAAEEEALHAASAMLVELFESRHARTGSTPFLTLLHGHAATERALAEAINDAQESVEELVRGPFASGSDTDMAPAQPAALARGVRYRVLYAADLLGDPSLLEVVRASVQMGEEARSHRSVPLRFIVSDRKRAVVLLGQPAADDPRGFHAVVVDGLAVGPSPFLDALIRLFEEFWRAGTPLDALDREGTVDEHELLRLLGLGLTDATIGRALGISERTVHRRVSAIATRLGVTGRFQLGAEAQRQGLLEGVAPVF